MKSAVFLLLLGAVCALAAETKTTPETETETSPDFDVSTESDESVEEESPAANSTCFTCGDHNCSEMELLESILHSLNDFTPCNCQCNCHHAPGGMFEQPAQQSAKPNGMFEQPQKSCCESNGMVLKVAGLLQSLSSVLSMCGAPAPHCCHHHQHSHPNAPVFHQPQPMIPTTPDFDDLQNPDFDESIDELISVLMSQMQQEVVTEELASGEEVAVDDEKEKAEEKKETTAETPEEKNEIKKTPVEGGEKKETDGEQTPKPKRKSSKKRPKESVPTSDAEEKEPAEMNLMDVLNMTAR